MHASARARTRALAAGMAQGRALHGAPARGSDPVAMAAAADQRPSKSSHFSAFVAPTTWDRSEGAAEDDSRFWLGKDGGLVRGSQEDLQIKWLAASVADPAFYLFEGDNTEDVSQRFATHVQLEEEGDGFRLPALERARLIEVLEAFNKEKELVVERSTAGQRKGEARDECSLCIEHHGEDDEQVLCDTCNQGFHIECLERESIYFPENVFEDGVDWDCKQCSLSREASVLSSYEAEGLTVNDVQVRISRKGRQIRPPTRVGHLIMLAKLKGGS